MATWFISDLHLCKQRPAVTDQFLSFLANDAFGIEALYILGDLFEYWIGDEAASFQEHKPIISALKNVTKAGTPVLVIRGNRDVLLGQGFERASGCRLLNDPTVIQLYGQPTLISHGDYLCTDDGEYQKYRAMVQDADFQQRFLAKDIDEREAIIQTYREISQDSSAGKQPEIMDINQNTIEQQMRDHEVHRLIHGHTHRPQVHEFVLDGNTVQRLVLGDWYDQASVLECDTQGCKLKSIPRLITDTPQTSIQT